MNSRDICAVCDCNETFVTDDAQMQWIVLIFLWKFIWKNDKIDRMISRIR